MRDVLTSSRRWLRAGWFWPLVLLALPNCSQVPHFVNLEAGPEPRTSAIMCDIPKVGFPVCAAPGNAGTRLTQAAIALRNGGGVNNTIGLDDSPAANACSPQPLKTEFQGKFPAGFQVCLNASTQIPAVYADGNVVCVRQCLDLLDGGPEPPGGIDAFCQANAHVSTNFDKLSPYPNACSSAGTPIFFVDPRGTPEDVKWTAQDLIGTCLADAGSTTCGSGGNLMRSADTTGTDTADFNAGGASDQVITHGDGWVEFEARETNLSHVLGLRFTACNTTPCKDADPSLDDPDPSLTDMSFGISLNANGNVYVIESDGINPPNVYGPFGQPYAANERFRVHFDDNFDGTATISYWRVDETGGPCKTSAPCVESKLATQTLPSPKFPLRVDVSFREKDAMVKDVTLVRIKDQ
jgi:hypothetical protein